MAQTPILGHLYQSFPEVTCFAIIAQGLLPTYWFYCSAFVLQVSKSQALMMTSIDQRKCCADPPSIHRAASKLFSASDSGVFAA